VSIGPTHDEPMPMKSYRRTFPPFAVLLSRQVPSAIRMTRPIDHRLSG